MNSPHTLFDEPSTTPVATCFPSKKEEQWLAILLLLLAPFIFGVFSVLLGQDTSWDLRNYHWYNAYSFLNNREIKDLLPSQNAYFYNPLLDVPFYLLATRVPAIVAGYVQGFIQGLNFPILFMLAYSTISLAHPRRKVVVCTAIAALGLLGGGGIGEIGTTFNDNIISLGLLLSALLIVRYLENATTIAHATALLAASGSLAGAMMGLKLTSVVFCVGYCGALLFSVRPFSRGLITSFVFGVGVLLGLALTYGYWGWFLQTHFGSPTFPFFNTFFKSPFAPQTDMRDVTFLPKSIREYLLYPLIFAKHPERVGEMWWRDWRIPLLYMLLPVVVMLRLLKRDYKPETSGLMVRPFAGLFILLAGSFSYVVWLFMFSIYRYAVPLEMLTPLLLIVAVSLLPFENCKKWIIAGALIFVVACSVHAATWGRLSEWKPRYVQATLPPLGNTSDLMVLIAGTEALSHLVTQFPAEIPFVRIQSFTSLATGDRQQTEAMTNLIQMKLASHAGRFLVLFNGTEREIVRHGLARFGFDLAEPCNPVIDQLNSEAPVQLCSVAPITVEK